MANTQRIMATPATKPIRILLIDDHAVVRSGLRLLIETQPGLEVVGEAGNRDDALAIAASVLPDIILLDIDLTASTASTSFPSC